MTTRPETSDVSLIGAAEDLVAKERPLVGGGTQFTDGKSKTVDDFRRQIEESGRIFTQKIQQSQERFRTEVADAGRRTSVGRTLSVPAAKETLATVKELVTGEVTVAVRPEAAGLRRAYSDTTLEVEGGTFSKILVEPNGEPPVVVTTGRTETCLLYTSPSPRD